jgi:hypothetical protein
MTNKSRKVKSAHISRIRRTTAWWMARDSQAADVGVAGGDTQRDPLYALGIGRGHRGRSCRARLGGGARTAARLAARLAARASRAAGAHVDGLGGAQADGLGGAAGAEEPTIGRSESAWRASVSTSSGCMRTCAPSWRSLRAARRCVCEARSL